MHVVCYNCKFIIRRCFRIVSIQFNSFLECWYFTNSNSVFNSSFKKFTRLVTFTFLLTSQRLLNLKKILKLKCFLCSVHPLTLPNFISFDTQIVNKICSKTTKEIFLALIYIPLIKCISINNPTLKSMIFKYIFSS